MDYTQILLIGLFGLAFVGVFILSHCETKPRKALHNLDNVMEKK